jgi:polar amino acid transport system substrate-binding protein
MVQAGNPKRLTSYRALAADTDARLVVVADQVQEQRALSAGLDPARVRRVATQPDAVAAVREGRADAYASVAMAHRGFLRATPDAKLEVVDFGAVGGAVAEGAYSFAKANTDLRHSFDVALARFLGAPEHRAIMRRYDFADADVERVLSRRTHA